MAIECGQCPKTFRTQNGKEWHLYHIHSDLPVKGSSGEIKTDDLSAIVENEITAHIEPNSLTPYLGDLKPAKVEDESDPLTPYLHDDEPDEVKNGSDPLAPYLHDAKPVEVKDESNALTPYLRDQEPAKVEDGSDPLAPYLREWKPARPVKIAEMGCEFSTTLTSCSLHRGHQRSVALQAPTLTLWPGSKDSLDNAVRDALRYCGYTA